MLPVQEGTKVHLAYLPCNTPSGSQSVQEGLEWREDDGWEGGSESDVKSRKVRPPEPEADFPVIDFTNLYQIYISAKEWAGSQGIDHWDRVLSLLP